MTGEPLDDSARLAALDRTGLMETTADPVLARLTRLASRLVGAPVSLVSLVDDQRQHFAAQVGLALPVAEEAQTPLSHSFCQHVVTSGERFVVTDAKADPRVSDNKGIDDLGVHAYAGFPLVDDDGHVLGSFCVIDDAPREWTEEELAGVADVAAAAASEIRARAALRTSAARVALLADVTLALHADVGVEAAARALAERLVPALADLCIVDLVERAPHGRSITVAVGTDPSIQHRFEVAEARRSRLSVPGSGVQRVVRGGPGLRVAVDDAAIARVSADDEQRELYRSLGLVEMIVAPVVSQAGAEGALTLARTASSRGYDDEDLQLAAEIGRRIGVAVENARLYARERTTAVTLQHSLLPRLPELERLDLAARYLPSSEAGQVGGDWYDVLPLPDGSVGVAVGDVAGHDVTAAAGMGQLRAVLRSYAWDDPSPGRVLDRVCRLVRGLDEDTMATVLYARLSPARRDGSRGLVYSSAGHPPPVLVLPDGAARLLEVVSAVIGIETEPRAQTEIVVPPGALLVCYSDGLVERRGEHLDVGLERLRRVTARAALESGSTDGVRAEAVAERVLAGMLDGRAQEDDVALLVIGLH